MSLQRAAVLLLSLTAATCFAGCKRDAFCVDCLADDAGGGDGDGDGTGGEFGFNPDSGTGGAGSSDGGTGGMGPDVCTPRDDGLELCNGLDDDCDGLSDEGFNFDADPQHCGGCNMPCEGENAEATCTAGVCEVGACFDGFVDLDASAGCEYRCPVFPARDEDCNGLDDDCDAEVDEELPAPPTNLCQTRAGTPCQDTVAACDTVDGVTTWYCQYDAAVEFDPTLPNGILLEETRCDLLDGDCDGKADDPWPGTGEICDDGALGVCRDVGVTICDPADVGALVCDFSALPDPLIAGDELCNDLDDDCDGDVDEDVVDDMVFVDDGGAGFYVFRHEASHPDATSDVQGLATHRACSNPSVLPWTYLTHAQAQAACVASGKRLCTGAEWGLACGATAYPYGDGYGAMTCNGADHGADALLPTGSLAGCQSGGGTLDMSGNAKEWTSESPVADIFVVRGGSHQSPQLGLTCDTTLSQAAASPGQAAIGFRCCSDAAP